VIQAITTEADVSLADIEKVVVATAVEHGRAIAKGNGNVNPQTSARSRSRATRA
jgi:nucleoside 2-deoxyribosyltransferase